MKNAQLGCLAMLASVGGLIVVLAVKSPAFAILAGLVFVLVAAVSLARLLQSKPLFGVFLGIVFLGTSLLLFAASWTISQDNKKEAEERVAQEEQAKAEQAAKDQRHEEIRASAGEILEESKTLF